MVGWLETWMGSWERRGEMLLISRWMHLPDFRSEYSSGRGWTGFRCVLGDAAGAEEFWVWFCFRVRVRFV